jgi:DNA-binding CsgD family transcriptional regulator
MGFLFGYRQNVSGARLKGVGRTEIRPNLAELNDRETEILTWAARGKTSAQIAEMLGLAKRTVDFHLDNARNKLDAATRTEAVVKSGLLEAPSLKAGNPPAWRVAPDARTGTAFCAPMRWDGGTNQPH